MNYFDYFKREIEPDRHRRLLALPPNFRAAVCAGARLKSMELLFFGRGKDMPKKETKSYIAAIKRANKNEMAYRKKWEQMFEKIEGRAQNSNEKQRTNLCGTDGEVGAAAADSANSSQTPQS